MVAPARNRVAAAAARAAPDLDVIFMGILQKKCEGASPASSESSSRQTAPRESYAAALALVTRAAEFISAAGSKQRGTGGAGPSPLLIRRLDIDELAAYDGVPRPGSH